VIGALAHQASAQGWQVVVKDVEDESEVPQGLKDALAQQENS
jgi:hypothetical protein